MFEFLMQKQEFVMDKCEKFAAPGRWVGDGPYDAGSVLPTRSPIAYPSWATRVWAGHRGGPAATVTRSCVSSSPTC